jgi:hypothetical protein
VKPKATSDFVAIPSDQVRVAPSDAEISDLLRAAARQHSEAGGQAADSDAPVPAVDTTFRASAVNDDVSGRKSLLRRGAMRLVTGLLVAVGIGGAALTWQTFGYAAKKALFTWAPKWAIAASIPLDKLGLGPEAKPSDEPAEAASALATPDASDAGASATTAASTSSPDSTLQSPQLQSMARDLASANQEIETLKASIAELKANQQQMARDLAKNSDKLAEQNAKAKLAAATPRPPQAPHKPAQPYAPSAAYSPTSTPVPTPSAAYRPAPSSYSAQASMPQPSAAAQPVPLQPQADPGIVGSAPRPPMPVQ